MARMVISVVKQRAMCASMPRSGRRRCACLLQFGKGKATGSQRQQCYTLALTLLLLHLAHPSQSRNKEQTPLSPSMTALAAAYLCAIYPPIRQNSALSPSSGSFTHISTGSHLLRSQNEVGQTPKALKTRPGTHLSTPCSI
ncbi:hypothetical protein K437DRAFT_254056 [Tilletiaria anomala UBC 951]|uniref:Uncharacterized protein n=1 Tax=Tilletiaria anomala (strain ATCC 24038 / CBS 436.72 / UBC 951) TaxID=1037660 RepID=A0A066WF96_TILAU|nr:uncharacterized protein K437DRAFT_254056 [Tilletiaria anomala UBC 951]KDN52652.1 hypothetical protein K437DRAFT_254056 [Tilletiaria anomala UBC 951]